MKKRLLALLTALAMILCCASVMAETATATGTATVQGFGGDITVSVTLDGTDIQAVEITGPGEYTVALDFTGMEKGYASNTAFSATGISNGEQKFPSYCIYFTEVVVNGEPLKLKGRNYTCSDDGKCTRSNLYNEWVDIKNARSGARVLFGDLTGISATVLNREAPGMQQIRTLEITFRYEPRK